MEIKTLGELCNIVSGGTPLRSKPEYWNNGTIPWIKIGDIKEKYINNADEYITKAGLDGSSAKMLPKGTILYTIFATLGEVGILEIDASTNQAIAGLTIKDKNQILSEYLYYYLKSKKRYVKTIGRGVAQSNINMSILKSFQVPLPSPSTQNRIIDVLDKITNIIEYRQQELQKLDDLIKARFVEMFGDPAGKMNNYPKKRFDELCENLDSKRKPITASVRESGNYPYYGASGIVDYVADYIFDEDILLVSEDGANLLMRSTPIAFSVSGKVWVNNHAHVVRFKNIYMQKYIEVYFSMIDISDQITGSAQPKLNQAKLNALEFALPEDALLLEYYDFVAQIDKSKLLSGCRLFHSWAPENRDKPKHVGVPQRKTKGLRGGRRQQ